MELLLSMSLLFIVWLSLAWQINRRFQVLEERLDDRVSAIHEQFDGLREYLYEIDPQFAEELEAERDLASGDVWSGSILHQIQHEKTTAGKRTLRTRFRQ